MPINIARVQSCPKKVIDRWLRLKLNSIKYYPENISQLWVKAKVVDLPSIQMFDISENEDGSYRGGKPKIFTREQERYLFLKYNYARYVLHSMGKKPFTKSNCNRMLELWTEIEGYESYIINANMALVLTISRQQYQSLDSRNDLISDCQYSLLRAMRGFDVDRGWKFSTYACSSLVRGTYRYHSQRSKWTDNNKQFRPTFKESIPQDTSNNVSDLIEDTEMVVTLRKVISENLANLSDREMLVVRRRYFDKKGTKNTLNGIGRDVGITKERIRQVEIEALEKIRLYFASVDMANSH